MLRHTFSVRQIINDHHNRRYDVTHVNCFEIELGCALRLAVNPCLLLFVGLYQRISANVLDPCMDRIAC